MLSFHEATAHDPRYALPHAGLADAFLAAGFAGALPPREAWALAAESSRQALALDDRIPEPHVSAGFLRLLQDWDWDGAECECGAPSRWRPTPPPRTSGSASSSTFAAARTTQPARCGGPKSWMRSRWSSRPSVGLHRAFGGEHEAGLAQARRTLELQPAPVPRPLGGGERPTEPRPSRRGGGRAPACPRSGRGNRLHEARSRAQPGPRRPGRCGWCGRSWPRRGRPARHPTRRRASTSRWASRTARSSPWPLRPPSGTPGSSSSPWTR